MTVKALMEDLLPKEWHLPIQSGQIVNNIICQGTG